MDEHDEFSLFLGLRKTKIYITLIKTRKFLANTCGDGLLSLFYEKL